MRRRNTVFLLVTAAAVVATLVAAPDWEALLERAREFAGGGASPTDPRSPRSSERRLALPERGWINAAPRSIASTRHAAAVVIFADTHPNARAVLNTARSWHEAYARFDLEVVGIHSPEYAFAAEASYARRVVDRHALTFPVANDPGLVTLAAFGSNAADPQVVLLMPGGEIRSVWTIATPAELPAVDHAVNRFVRESNPERSFPATPIDPPAIETAPSPMRRLRLGVPSVHEGPLAGAAMGRAQPFTAAFRHEVEGALWVPHPVGWWKPGAEGIEAARGGAANFLAIRYDARRVGLVAAPGSGSETRIYVLLDEKWVPAAMAGPDLRLDADGASFVPLDEPRLYRILNTSGRHVLKLSPRDANATFHALTFEFD